MKSRLYVSLSVIWMTLFTFETAVAQSTRSTMYLRDSIKTEWVEYVRQICDETRDPEAQLIFDSVIRKMNVPLHPEDSISEDNSLLFFFPIFLEDTCIPIARRILVNPMQSAAYYGPNRTIYVKPSLRISNFGIGLMLLHEGRHAFDLRTPMLRFFQTPASTACSEVRAYTMCSRIMAEFGGSLYQTILADEMKRIRGLLSTTRYLHIDSMQVFPKYRADYDRRLDKIVYPALSVSEEAMRGYCLWTDAAFRILDEVYGPINAGPLKVALIEYSYRSDGLVPK